MYVNEFINMMVLCLQCVETKVVVLTGNGKAFCTGHDIKVSHIFIFTLLAFASHGTLW